MHALIEKDCNIRAYFTHVNARVTYTLQIN